MLLTMHNLAKNKIGMRPQIVASVKRRKQFSISFACALADGAYSF